MYLSFKTTSNKILNMLYFILWIFTGNFVLLNLILAILLDGFGLGSDEEEEIMDDLELGKKPKKDV